MLEHRLQVIAPTVLEISWVKRHGENTNSRTFAAAPPPQLSTTDVVVTVDDQPVAVSAIGFKRRAVYAPLSHRDIRVASFLYFEMDHPIAVGQAVRVTLPKHIVPSQMPAVNVALDRVSPAIHVNQVGYSPDLSKRAIVGYYLGSLGELPIDPDSTFQVVDAASGQEVHRGTLMRRSDEGFTYEVSPYQQVFEADFTALTREGTYRLVIPGLGSSHPFRVHVGTPAAWTRAYALGLYHQRCGVANTQPYTRFTHEVCHIARASVPTASFAAVEKHLRQTSSLQGLHSSLFPFVRQGSVDVSGGHHDAGDYSKYTINSAHMIHHLVFAADAFPGVGSLDNLGLPESGDGQNDLLQIAKWEADFLVKMQDTDGGFYFLVYPEKRRYEDDVLPDRGDPQVVFPKNTAGTAAAVAALAQAASSPLMRREFPRSADRYLAAARRGWDFLETAWTQHGRTKAYQKLTHYGDIFKDNDEIIWALTELYLATGDSTLHERLLAEFDPGNGATRRWGWWRLFEGYGNAIRSYAFARRTGRMELDNLNPVHLRACEKELRTAAGAKLAYSKGHAYRTSFPFENKRFRTAGWYFSTSEAFDLAVSFQLQRDPRLIAGIIANIDFEGGVNPNNIAFLTGVGYRRQREIVHQYAQNDRRVLPPSGIPLGSIQRGFHYTRRYEQSLAKFTFPADEHPQNPYPLYDRWSDTFNTTTEFTIVTQARSLAVSAFLMARTRFKEQPWNHATASIVGIPEKFGSRASVTARLSVEGLDPRLAQVVWDVVGREPVFAPSYEIKDLAPGRHWIEAEALWPDGRRVSARFDFDVIKRHPGS